MKRVMVLGAGFMGHSIAQVCANGGYEVDLWDLTDELAQKGYDSIAQGLDRQVARGKDTRDSAYCPPRSSLPHVSVIS